MILFVTVDCDVQHRRTLSEHLATQLVLLPDGGRSDPENESDSDLGVANQSSDDDDKDDAPLTQYVRLRTQDDATESSDNDIPLTNWRTKNCSKPSTSAKQKNNKNAYSFKWVKGAQQPTHDIYC